MGILNFLATAWEIKNGGYEIIQWAPMGGNGKNNLGDCLFSCILIIRYGIFGALII